MIQEVGAILGPWVGAGLGSVCPKLKPNKQTRAPYLPAITGSNISDLKSFLSTLIKASFSQFLLGVI